MRRFIADCITLVRVPVIVLLVLPAVALGWDSPELIFWLYIAGLLSHGLDGTVARDVRENSIWHTLDTMVLSVGLQIAAAAALFHELGTPWWLATAIMISYLIVIGLVEGEYIEPRKQRGEPFVPVILFGSVFVWLSLGGALAYQAYETSDSTGLAVLGLIAYGLCHGFLLHEEVWNRWFDEFMPKKPK